MAVRKSELSSQFTVQQRREIDALEAKIDAYLKAKYIGQKIVPIEIEEYPHDKVRKEIERRFRRAKWKIKFEHSQLGGNKIVLS